MWHESRTSFTQVPDWLLAHPEVSDAALRTWLVLASYADRQGEAFPGVATIAKKRGKSRRQIFEHLDNLERAGAIRRHARYRPNGGRTSTLYVIAWAGPLPPEPPKDAPETVGADTCTHDMGAETRTRPRDETNTPRTRPTNELQPLTPSVDNSSSSRSESLRGGGPPRTPARRSPRKKNPRALGTNPRAVAKRAAEAEERTAKLDGARRRGWNAARLTNPAPYGTVGEYREHLVEEARRHLREIDAELLEAEVAGYADGLASVPRHASMFATSDSLIAASVESPTSTRTIATLIPAEASTEANSAARPRRDLDRPAT